ncbi:MAG: hypothetical protein V1798_00265 [Pseudomonadota bacterium]
MHIRTYWIIGGFSFLGLFSVPAWAVDGDTDQPMLNPPRSTAERAQPCIQKIYEELGIERDGTFDLTGSHDMVRLDIATELAASNCAKATQIVRRYLNTLFEAVAIKQSKLGFKANLEKIHSVRIEDCSMPWRYYAIVNGMGLVSWKKEHRVLGLGVFRPPLNRGAVDVDRDSTFVAEQLPGALEDDWDLRVAGMPSPRGSKDYR